MREADFDQLAKIQAELFEKDVQFVHDVKVCSKYPIYGYSPKRKHFLKIEMYDAWLIKQAANILREGGVFGVPMQPYDAHISWHLHFFGDHCLGGNEYLKASEYFIRHLPKVAGVDLKRKTYYDLLFREAADQVLLAQSEAVDFSFLQDAPELKIWHQEMPELSSYLGQSAGKFGSLSSPYPRQTQSEIEIDCNCVDILNILERRDLRREILDFSLASQENSQHPLASIMSPKVEIPHDFFGQ
jgi:hypothetical protein